jgi:hypothetical protein
MRSGKPCSARERRASSAPACRIAARSWSLRGCRALSPGVLVPSARPAAGVRASRADARAVTEPGCPEPESFPVLRCLRAILNEEWPHRLYAERDLDALERQPG